MALRGVWQLQKLIVNYCDWAGSSRGIRSRGHYHERERSYLGLSPENGVYPYIYCIHPENVGNMGVPLSFFKHLALRGVYCVFTKRTGNGALMDSHLPAFREKNPQLEVVTELIRGQHPHLRGFYWNKNERMICIWIRRESFCMQHG